MKSLLPYLIVCVLIFGFCFYEFKCNKGKLNPEQVKRLERLDAEQIANIKNSKEDTTKHTISKEGKIISEKSVSVGNLKQIKPFYQKELTKAGVKTGVKEDKIENLLSADVNSEIDTELKGIFSFDDSLIHFELKGDCYKGNAEFDGVNLKLGIRQSINVNGVVYWKHKYWIGKRVLRRVFKHERDVETINKMWSDCPNVSIDSISSVQIIKGFH